MSQNTSHAVMSQRKEPHNSLDHFPTPPWATRALCEWLGGRDVLGTLRALEPACGEGHMSNPLAEYFAAVTSSDVHDYGYGKVEDFLFPAPADFAGEWIITNPPFRLAEQFALNAINVARVGVALLVRTVFLEGGARWRELFDPYPPTDILIFCERVPMLKGRLDKAASSATSYAWFMWNFPMSDCTRLHWLPPGTRKRLERDEDYA